MPTRWSATLSAATDAGLVLTDLGSRFASCSFTTSLNAGFDQMQTALRQPGGSRDHPRIPIDLAAEIFRTWRGMIGRVYIEGALAWAGRVADIFIHDQDGESCAVDLGWLGFVHDLEREQPELNASYSDEFATVSASELVRTVVDQSVSPIAHRYVFVQETAINIGPVTTSMQDSSLSLILNQLKGASSNGIEYAFLVWDPADGPYLVPIGVGPAQYRIRMTESPGTGVRWSLTEYVSDVTALFTNGDGVSDATDSAQSTDGPTLNSGLRSSRAISVDAVNADGAAAARDAFLALHGDPVGVTGAFQIQDFIQNDEGGVELAGLVRAGELAVVLDMLPFDSILDRAGRTKAIASTSYDVFSGQLSITLDQRAIQSRDNERMTDIRVGQRVSDPGAGGILAQAFDAVGTASNPDDTDILLDTISLTFTATRSPTEIEIVAEAALHAATAGVGGQVWLGYTLDGATWDHTDDDVATMAAYAATGTAGEDQPLAIRRRLVVSSGAHRVDFYARQNIAAAGVYIRLASRVSR